MKESTIQRQIIAYLREQGFLVWKISDRFRSGIPDLYCCRGVKDGAWKVSFWLEVKRPGGKVTALQAHEIAELRAQGVGAWVVSSVDMVAAILDAAMRP